MKEFTFEELRSRMFDDGKPMDIVKGEIFTMIYSDGSRKLFRCTKNELKKKGGFHFKMKEVR